MASVPNTTTSILSHPKAFSVAIIGGGIGGLSLALGLLSYPHIDVHVYESAPSFGEIGAGVGFGPNAQRALELLAPAATEAFVKHATGYMWASHTNTFIEYRVGKGEHENETIHAETNATGMQGVHRAYFLDELVAAVPNQRAHFNKRLDTIVDEPEKEVVLHFKDGTTATADAVIGADGIHSHVREYLLGKEAAKPVFAGAAAYRGLVSMDAAVEKLGAEFAQNSFMLCGPGKTLYAHARPAVRYVAAISSWPLETPGTLPLDAATFSDSWSGPCESVLTTCTGKAILSYPIDHGQIFNIVILDFEHEHWEEANWIVSAKREVLNRLFSGWGTKAKGLIDLLDTPDLATWAMFEAPVAAFYSKNRVCMMGDAAHATTPFQGQGAAQAIEDALVLTTLLAKITAPGQISNAFTAYDETRRLRAQRVVKTSREAGELFGMKQEGVGADLGKMRAKLETRMHWVWHRNVVAQNREAAGLFEETL